MPLFQEGIHSIHLMQSYMKTSKETYVVCHKICPLTHLRFGVLSTMKRKIIIEFIPETIFKQNGQNRYNNPVRYSTDMIMLR